MTVLKGELAVSQSKALVRTFKRMKDYIVENQGLINQRDFLQLSLVVADHGKDISMLKNSLDRIDNEEKLKYILSVYGEEKFAGNIAKNIILARKDKPIATTGELADICDKSIPFKFKKDGHPAKKTFQAIRIAVNEELDGLDTALYDVFSRLNKGGRLVVITFHSLEDRIVKNVFKDLETACTCDKRYPCVCNRVKRGIEITKKPITASENELKLNSRSKCAKLRIIEKL